MYYNQSIEEVFSILKSSEKGLSSQEAKKRIEVHGRNMIKEVKQDSPLKIFIRQFESLIIGVLFAVLAISLLLGEYVDAAVVGFIILLNAILGFIQEYNAEKAIQALKKLTSLKAKVLRDGRIGKIDASELVPGDIIYLEEGDKVPADARLFDLKEIDVQEATLTGESVSVNKRLGVVKSDSAVAERFNMVFSSTIVTRGHGRAVVCFTGMQSEIGKIAALIEEEPSHMTPLQKKLEGLGRWLSIVTIIACVIVFFVGIVKGNHFIQMFLASASLAVAAIPEGLPAVVTISLAIGVQQMAKRHALVRKLPSVETLGSVTVICSDKTGTLTYNEMTVKKVYINEEIVDVSGEGYHPSGNFSKEPKGLDLLLGIGALCNNASLHHDGSITGDPTEACLITSAAKHNVLKDALDRKFPRVDEITFTSSRKLMSTIHSVGSKRVVYSKGAPDVLLKHCTRIYDKGKVRKINEADRHEILDMNENFARRALRVLAFAYKDIDGRPKKYESDLIFVGLQGMIDPPRAEVKDAIAKCKAAGIKPIVITGDHKVTALAIAHDLGIEGKAISGEELDKVKDLHEIVDEIAIYARVSPEHKLRIVEALQKKGHIVAMTGDGVNDAPALKMADIGVCVGSGTDVAKEASEIVLTDDNYSSIINTVEEGRSIYDNIKKFVNYMLSSNAGEVLVILVAMILSLPLPLVAVQILWMNLLTDGMPALALGVDPVSKDVMSRPPRKTSEKIVSPNMTLNILIVGILVCVGTLFAFIYELNNFSSIDRARTVAFTTLVLLSFVRIYMVRVNYRLSLFSNKYLVLAIFSSVALQLLVIYTPLNAFLKTVPLVGFDWLLIGSVLVSAFVIGAIFSAIINAVTKTID